MDAQIKEYFPLAHGWPHRDTTLTVFRYGLLRDLCQGKRVLELGAATGEGTLLLADAAAEVVALDYQDRWAGSPAAASPHIRFVQGDAQSLPADWGGAFDVVLAMELIEHLEDPAAFQRSVFTVLNAGGVLAFSTPNFALYSDRGDGSTTPVYVHHRREYRAAQLRQAILPDWPVATILSISQLTPPEAADDGWVRSILCCDQNLFELRLGPQYPHYRLQRCGQLSAPLDLEKCQSYLVLLGKTAAASTKTVPPSVPELLPPVVLSMQDATFQSSLIVLQRRNEHVKELDQHATSLEGIKQDRERQLAALREQTAHLGGLARDREQQLENLRRHAANLEGIKQDRERQLVTLREQAVHLEGLAQDRERQLVTLRKQVVHLEGLAQDRERQLVTLRKQVVHLEGLAQDRERQLVTLREQVVHLEGLAQDREQQLVTLREQVVHLEGLAQDREQQLVTLREQVVHLEGLAQDRERQLVTLREQVVHLEGLAQDRERQLAALREQAAHLEGLAQDRERQLENLRWHAANLEGIKQDRELQLENLRQHAANLEDIVRDRERELKRWFRLPFLRSRNP